MDWKYYIATFVIGVLLILVGKLADIFFPDKNSLKTIGNKLLLILINLISFGAPIAGLSYLFVTFEYSKYDIFQAIILVFVFLYNVISRHLQILNKKQDDLQDSLDNVIDVLDKTVERISANQGHTQEVLALHKDLHNSVEKIAEIVNKITK